MRTFIAKSEKTGLKITFKYNTILRQLKFEGDWTNELINKN